MAVCYTSLILLGFLNWAGVYLYDSTKDSVGFLRLATDSGVDL